MTKEKLEQLRTLKIEIDLLEYELNSLPQTTDTVRGSMDTFPYTEVIIKVTGTDEASAPVLRNKLRQKHKKLHASILELEEWLDTIENSEMRTIIRMHYEHGMTHEEIARKFGCSKSTITKKINNFFKKQKLSPNSPKN